VIVLRRVACAGAVLLAAAVAAPAHAGTTGPTTGPTAGRGDTRPLFRIRDHRVIESSGLAVSRTRPGLAYTVNDSGDDAQVLVLSLRDGSVVGETTLTGAEPDDFEALAPAPGGRLLVGDTGDNDAERDSVEVYVIGEPARGVREVQPRTVELTYPDGPRDAEALVAAGDTVFVVSKEVFGSVYAAPALASSRDAFTLRRVAAAPSVVTDGALLPDGDVVLRGYGRGYLVRRPGWRVAGSFPLPRTQQGETVASRAHGRDVYVGSEGLQSPLYLVRAPTVTELARSDAPRSAGAAGPAGRAGAAHGRPDDPGFPRARPAGYLVAAAAALVIGWLARRRRKRRGRPPIQIR
jgi:hypothetical protein